MDPVELMRQVRDSLADHPGRVVASSLSLLCGSTALVLLLALGTGFREYLRVELGSFGRGCLTLRAGVTSSGFPGYRKGVPVRFTSDDAQRLEREQDRWIEAVLPEQMSGDRLMVTASGRARRLHLSASDERFGRYRDLEPALGRFINASDVIRRRNVAVLGPEAASDLFGSWDRAVGRSIRIEGRPFEVIGVTHRKGREYLNIGREDNRLVVVPITSAEAQLGFDEEDVTRLLVYPRFDVAPTRALEAALATLGPIANFHPNDVHAVHWTDTSELLSATDLFYAGFLVFIGFAGTLTLLVGALGIANHELAVLAERNVEFAVACALGARRRTLVGQTAAESLAVAATASVAGSVLGLSICGALVAAASKYDLPAPIVSGSAAGMVAVCLASVSVLTAAIPAWRVRHTEVSLALRAGR